MKRLLAALLLVASPVLAQENGWQEIQNGWGEIQTSPGAVSSACLATQVPFLGTPVTLGLVCDSGLTYDAATDTLTAGRVLVGDGSAAAPSVANATVPGNGLSFTATALKFSALGAERATLDAAGLTFAGSVAGITQANYFRSGVSQNVWMTFPAAATHQFGAVNSATPVAQTLQAQGGSGTDIAGANLTIQSGAGTSDATGSSLIFKTPADSGSTGTTPQTQVARVTIKELHINLRLGDIAIYANNAAALAGGLVAGDLYRTGADPDPVCIVH